MAVSRATANWRGDLMSGNGTVSGDSGSFTALPVSWAARSEREERTSTTSPEELIAAAHASCFNMAFSGSLARNGTPPESLDTAARAFFEQAENGFKITRIELDVRGRVPGLDAEQFRALAEQSKDGCPVSGALKGNVDVSLTATLEG